MDRRDLLASLGAGSIGSLAGCLGILTSGGERVRITDVAPDPPPDPSLEPTVGFHRNDATADRPAQLTVTWQNVSGSFIRIVDADRVLYGLNQSENEEAMLFLANRWPDEATAFGACWKVFIEKLNDDAAVETTKLQPGETHEGTPGLYVNGDPCLEAGTYRFTTSFIMYPMNMGGLNGNEKLEGAWGIDVTVEKVE